MSFLDDTYCQLCEKFITKEQWNKNLYSVDIYIKKLMVTHRLIPQTEN